MDFFQNNQLSISGIGQFDVGSTQVSRNKSEKSIECNVLSSNRGRQSFKEESSPTFDGATSKGVKSINIREGMNFYR